MKSPLDWKISPPASPFGDLAISRETHGFASSDYSEYAFIGRRFSVVDETRMQLGDQRSVKERSHKCPRNLTTGETTED
jgi:hypothetical protein